jgi:peptidoglycan/LPS O-acetylase OafA/YrhL
VDRVRGSTDRTGYIPALDGLRGVAIFLVLIHHVRGIFAPSLNRSFLPGCFLGVDIFFVLSGYLITSILLRARERGGVGFLSFYRGRAMRLLPALVVLLAAHSIYAWATGIPRNIEQPTATSILFYYYNWRHTIIGPAEVGHLWSLSVEEQFYIVWPLALIALLAATRGRRRVVAAVVVVAIVAVAIGRAWGWHQGTLWLWLYVQTNTRADSLLVGALLAIAGSHLATRSARWLTPAAWFATGFLAVCIGFAQFDKAPLYLGGFTVVALATATVILASLPGSTWHGARALQWGPLCTLGVVSYGLYLWHLPIFIGMQKYATGIPTAARAVLALAITALATYLSWVAVEQPFLRWKARLDRRTEPELPTTDAGVAAGVPRATS